jgi:hypothetical protein
VPYLHPDEVLAARQRFRGMVSVNGATGTVKREVRLAYAANSTFRLCQLTHDWEPTPRPHPVNTSGIGLIGTDLGVSVEHKGRVYFFFGDCVDSEGSEPDGDPIAWSTETDPDEFESRAPKMNWIVDATGQFRRLIVEGLPSLGNFEVPGGGFSYDGRLYLIITAQKHENPSRMTASFLAVGDDPQHNFKLLAAITSTVGETTARAVSGRALDAAHLPHCREQRGLAGAALEHGAGAHHVRVVDLSRGSGVGPDGEEKQMSNVYLAWAPLTPGQAPPLSPIPPANQWKFLVGFAGPGGTQPLWDILNGPMGRPPVPLLPPESGSAGCATVPALCERACGGVLPVAAAVGACGHGARGHEHGAVSVGAVDDGGGHLRSGSGGSRCGQLGPNGALDRLWRVRAVPGGALVAVGPLDTDRDDLLHAVGDRRQRGEAAISAAVDAVGDQVLRLSGANAPMRRVQRMPARVAATDWGERATAVRGIHRRQFRRVAGGFFVVAAAGEESEDAAADDFGGEVGAAAADAVAGELEGFEAFIAGVEGFVEDGFDKAGIEAAFEHLGLEQGAGGLFPLRGGAGGRRSRRGDHR